MIVALSVLSFSLLGALAALDLRGTVYRSWPVWRSALAGAAIGAVVGLALGLFLEGVRHG